MSDEMRAQKDMACAERNQLVAALAERDAAVAMLRKVERVIADDTAAEEERCCGWGPLLIEVRAVLRGDANPIDGRSCYQLSGRD